MAKRRQRRDRFGRFNRRGRFVAQDGKLVRVETIMKAMSLREARRRIKRLEEALEEEEDLVTVEYGGAFDSP